MRIKKCVGAILYDYSNKIILMQSPKWGDKWLISGGEIERGESEEGALRREIKEELGIEIYNLVRVGEKRKSPSLDFYDNNVEFHFIDYFARARQTDVVTNAEISRYDWFAPEDVLFLNLLNTSRELVEKFISDNVYLG